MCSVRPVPCCAVLRTCIVPCFACTCMPCVACVRAFAPYYIIIRTRFTQWRRVKYSMHAYAIWMMHGHVCYAVKLMNSIHSFGWLVGDEIINKLACFAICSVRCLAGQPGGIVEPDVGPLQRPRRPPRGRADHGAVRPGGLFVGGWEWEWERRGCAHRRRCHTQWCGRCRRQ